VDRRSKLEPFDLTENPRVANHALPPAPLTQSLDLARCTSCLCANNDAGRSFDRRRGVNGDRHQVSVFALDRASSSPLARSALRGRRGDSFGVALFLDSCGLFTRAAA
jgi:hypothetical protein